MEKNDKTKMKTIDTSKIKAAILADSKKTELSMGTCSMSFVGEKGEKNKQIVFNKEDDGSIGIYIDSKKEGSFSKYEFSRFVSKYFKVSEEVQAEKRIAEIKEDMDDEGVESSDD